LLRCFFFLQVPTSARTGQGVGELIDVVVRTALLRAAKLRQSDVVEAVVMEVRQAKGQATTLDVILKSGRLRVHDSVALCGCVAWVRQFIVYYL
jgi:translation initiation factor IF-2